MWLECVSCWCVWYYGSFRFFVLYVRVVFIVGWWRKWFWFSWWLVCRFVNWKSWLVSCCLSMLVRSFIWLMLLKFCWRLVLICFSVWKVWICSFWIWRVCCRVSCVWWWSLVLSILFCICLRCFRICIWKLVWVWWWLIVFRWLSVWLIIVMIWWLCFWYCRIWFWSFCFFWIIWLLLWCCWIICCVMLWSWFWRIWSFFCYWFVNWVLVFVRFVRSFFSNVVCIFCRFRRLFCWSFCVKGWLLVLVWFCCCVMWCIRNWLMVCCVNYWWRNCCFIVVGVWCMLRVNVWVWWFRCLLFLFVRSGCWLVSLLGVLLVLVVWVEVGGY